ncbi:hypothetical protein J5J10_10455 [Ciceribacter sp. L1K23]|uniref:hypothetical protein n=1 Tax=Ciceribacter sp. L1K23 TaxID=2820276 RepID=UPI001B846468|nr:hypothetical protein [Ciceribacter sp. L1K23]MBR0556097.1 hypothetical protein [Ciceribacter sp. L1K23]
MTLLIDGPQSLAQSASAPPSRSSTPEHILTVAIGFQLALAFPSIFAFLLDERLLNDISVWVKPLKFQASLVVMLATLLLLLPRIDATARHGRGILAAALTAAVTSTGEIVYITFQAARGRASHFNFETDAERLAYNLMGFGAAFLVLSSLVIGLYILLRPAPGTGTGLRLGGGWGLILGSVLTLVTAFTLGSGQIDGPGHWVGGVRSDAGGLFLFGWSRTGGDLRVPHFFATHIMQALPILGLILDRTAPAMARPGIVAGAIASVVVVALTFFQAIDGQPFL